MKNAMIFDDIYLLKDSAVKLVLKEIDVMDLEYAFFQDLKNCAINTMIRNQDMADACRPPRPEIKNLRHRYL